jgi:hypothetical protein
VILVQGIAPDRGQHPIESELFKKRERKDI